MRLLSLVVFFTALAFDSLLDASPLLTATGVNCRDYPATFCGDPHYPNHPFQFTTTLFSCPGGICGSTNYGCISETFSLTSTQAYWSCYENFYLPAEVTLERYFIVFQGTVDLTDFPNRGFSVTMPIDTNRSEWRRDAYNRAGAIIWEDHAALFGSVSITAPNIPVPEPVTPVLIGGLFLIGWKHRVNAPARR